MNELEIMTIFKSNVTAVKRASERAIQCCCLLGALVGIS